MNKDGIFLFRYERVLAIYERALPPNHPNLTYPLDGLATMAEKQGNYELAEELYQRALDISQKVLEMSMLKPPIVSVN